MAVAELELAVEVIEPEVAPEVAVMVMDAWEEEEVEDGLALKSHSRFSSVWLWNALQSREPSLASKQWPPLEASSDSTYALAAPHHETFCESAAAFLGSEGQLL